MCTAGAASYLDGLNEEQRAVVLAPLVPLRVLAGPGSGKTRVLTCRVAHLVASRVAPERILCITFTKKASNEMRERLDRALGLAAKGVRTGTFHSVSADVLKRHIGKLPGALRDHRFIIYDAEDACSLIRRLIKDLWPVAKKEEAQRNPDGSKKLQSPEAEKKAKEEKELRSPDGYQALISRSKNCMSRSYGKTGGEAWKALVEDGVSVFHPLAPFFPLLYDKYNAALARCNALDFDDMLSFTVELLASQPGLAAELAQQWPHVLCDEFQDTNFAQYEFIKLLAMQRTSPIARSLMVVGDVDQSIYGWRGAQVQLMRSRFANDVGAACMSLSLPSNYRSTPEVLAVADAVLTPASETRSELRVAPMLPSGVPVCIWTIDTGRFEGETVVHEIQRLLLGAEGRSKLLGSQIAVLYRANWQSREFERALLKKSIPYEVVNGLPFFQRREIKDLTSYLRLVANPRDEVAFQRVVNTPTRGIGDTTLDALTAWAKLNKQTLSAALLTDVDESLPSAKLLGITARAHGFVCDFRAMVASWQRKAAALPVRGLLQQIVTDIAYEKHLEDDDDVDERLGNVEELLSLAATPAEGADPDAPLPTGLDALSGFLEDAALMSAQDMANKELPNSVRLQTMHSAKGLEFEAVFAVGLEDDIIPSPRALKDAGPRYGEVYDEERRLFYVAVTRAKARLYLCHAQSRYMYGELTSQDISPLLGDVVHALGRDAKRVLLKEFAEPQREAAARAYDSSGSVGAGKWDTDARMRAHVPRPMAAGRTRAASTVAAGRRPPLPPPAPMTPQRSQAKTAQTLSDGQGMAALMAQKAAAAAAKRAAKGTS